MESLPTRIEHNSYGRTPLHLATLKNDLKEVEQLLNSNAENINSVDNRGTTALHFAAANDFVELTQFLLEKGANINVSNQDGATALFSAVSFGNERIVSILLKAGSQVNVQDINGRSPLHQVALMVGTVAIAKLLVNSGARIDLRDKLNQTPFHTAVKSGSIDLIRFLRSKGAVMTLPDIFGNDPFDLLLNRIQMNMGGFFKR
jgi:ankyrin repeat protein